MKPPAFQFYADDFLAGTMDMAPEELGIYIRLLCFQWNRGSLPADPVRLSRLAGCDVPEIVLEKFTADDAGNLRNHRLEAERVKQAEYRDRQSAAGRRGGRPQKGLKKGSLSQPFSENTVLQKGSLSQPFSENTVLQKGSQSSPSPSPSPIAEERERELGDAQIPSESEVIAFGDRSGVPEDVCRKFHAHYDGNNLWLNQHGRPIKWQIKLTQWQAREREREHAGRSDSPANARNGTVSESVAIIRDTKALERCEARRKQIREKYDHHMDWSLEDRKEDKQLREQIEILKRQLNFAA